MDFDDDVIAASFRQPVLVDFHATWCGPCRMLAPVIAEAVRRAPGPVRLVKVDTDEHPDIAQRFGVSGIPDVRLYVDGRVAGSFTGFRGLGEVERFLAERLPTSSGR